jgi:hypothetical protein
MANQFQHYQYVFHSWTLQFPEFIQLFIWMVILGLVIRIGFEIAKWAFIGGLTLLAVSIGGIAFGIKKAAE